jgi:hypothetical protein
MPDADVLAGLAGRPADGRDLHETRLRWSGAVVRAAGMLAALARRGTIPPNTSPFALNRFGQGAAHEDLHFL